MRSTIEALPSLRGATATTRPWMRDWRLAWNDLSPLHHGLACLGPARHQRRPVALQALALRPVLDNAQHGVLRGRHRPHLRRAVPSGRPRLHPLSRRQHDDLDVDADVDQRRVQRLHRGCALSAAGGPAEDVLHHAGDGAQLRCLRSQHHHHTARLHDLPLCAEPGRAACHSGAFPGAARGLRSVAQPCDPVHAVPRHAPDRHEPAATGLLRDAHHVACWSNSARMRIISRC